MQSTHEIVILKILKIFDFWIEGSILIYAFLAIYSGVNIYIIVELNPAI